MRRFGIATLALVAMVWGFEAFVHVWAWSKGQAFSDSPWECLSDKALLTLWALCAFCQSIDAYIEEQFASRRRTDGGVR